jgi:transcriptional regulator with XRE-family HTH domain
MNDLEFLIKLGRRIATVRKAKGFSQFDLGAIIEMEKSNLSAIENGRQNPTSLTLKKIADALNVKVEEFFKDIN